MRSPEGLVSPQTPVEMSWPAGVQIVSKPTISSDAGALVFEWETQEGRLRAVPAPSWPLGAVVAVDFSESFIGPTGRAVGPLLQFEVVAKSDAFAAPRLRFPSPGTRVPTNLAWLQLTGPASEPLWLEDGSGARTMLRHAEEDGRWEVEAIPGCKTLCPERTYTVRTATGASLGMIRTATSADEVPPRFVSARAEIEPGRPRALLQPNETVSARGWVRIGERVSRLGAVAGSAHAWLETYVDVETPPEVAAELSLEIEDLAGAVTSTTFRLRTPPEIRVRITELVPTALRDWGDSEPSMAPFDPWPGTGAVTSADEWVEVVNDGFESIDLTQLALEVRVLDRTPSSTRLDDAPSVYFGDGGRLQRWAPGEALVVRTRGDMSQRGVAIEIRAGAVLLDRVLLAQSAQADHPGGAPPDLEHEAIAVGVDGRFAWCRATPGDPRPARRCLD